MVAFKAEKVEGGWIIDIKGNANATLVSFGLESIGAVESKTKVVTTDDALLEEFKSFVEKSNLKRQEVEVLNEG